MVTVQELIRVDLSEDTYISGEREAVKMVVELLTKTEGFWESIDNETGHVETVFMLMLNEVYWESLVCHQWGGSLDGDIFHFMPFKYKYKKDCVHLYINEYFKFVFDLKHIPFFKDDKNSKVF